MGFFIFFVLYIRIYFSCRRCENVKREIIIIIIIEWIESYLWYYVVVKELGGNGWGNKVDFNMWIENLNKL